MGQKPHAALERLQAHPQVVLTGWVDQIEPYLAGADIVVVPLRMGSGTRLKVLQALSMARPLVGTPLGCSGLGLRDTQHLRLADDSATFAAAISELLGDRTRFEMAERGGGMCKNTLIGKSWCQNWKRRLEQGLSATLAWRENKG